MPGQRYEADEAEFGFTSMIDVVFLLLIFFLLQPFKSPEQKLDSPLPRDDGSRAEAPSPRVDVRLRVLRHPADPGAAVYYVNRRRVGFDSARIAPALLRAAGGDRTVPVTLAPEDSVRFGPVLRALDQCRVAEMRRLRFAAPPAR